MKQFKVLFILCVLLFSAVLLDRMSKTNFNWGRIPERDEMYLLEWGRFDNGAGLFSVFTTKERDCSLCDEKVRLEPGKNAFKFDPESCGPRVELSCPGMNLSFVSSNVVQPQAEYLVTNFDSIYGNGTLDVTVRGRGNLYGYRIMEFYLDGELVHSPALLLNGSFEFTEKIDAAPGDHTIVAKFEGREVYRGAFFASGKPFPAELLMLLFSSGGLAILLYTRGEKPLLALLAFAVLAVFGFVYQFQLANNFGIWNWILPLVYFGVFIWELAGKR